MKRIIIALLALLLLLACQPTPEEDAVKQKDTVAMIDTVRDANANEPDGAKTSVRDQMPGRLEWDFTTETRNVHITADAPIRVLSDGGFPLLRCERRGFGAADNLAICKALMHADTVYESVPQRTKKDVAKQIEGLMEVLNDTERKSEIWKDYTEEEIENELLPMWREKLQALQELYRTLPDTDDPVPNPVWDGRIDVQTTVVAGPYDDQLRDCDFTVLDVGQEEPHFWQLHYTKASEWNSSWYYGDIETIDPSQYDTAHPGASMTPDQAIASVQALLDPFVRTAVNGVYWDDNRSDTSGADSDFHLKEAYIVELCPVYYGSAAGMYLSTSTAGEDVEMQGGSYAPLWNRELIVAAVNDEGVLMLVWQEPLKVTEVVSENCPLLPFEEIETIAKQQLNRCLANDWQQNGSVTISRVELGLVRIAEPNEMERALLAPVWCVFGEGNYPGIPQPIRYNSGNPLLMINAIDGTIIDARKGY
jgi:hypothetical protein